jgi:lipopolysaccharide transport system permease protein
MEYQIRPKEKFEIGLRELWQYRELFYFFTWRDIRVKYKQTFFGFAWAVFQPLMFMFLFTLIFKKAIGNNTYADSAIPYPLFAYSGLILWNIFSIGVSTAGTSMVSNANIIRKIYFPRLIIPISAILVALFDFAMTIPLLIGMLIWYGICPSVHAIWQIPAGILLAFIATIGPGTLLASLNVKFRDFRYIIPFVVQIMLFATPVIYPENHFSQRWVQEVFALNPMSAAITLFRSGITGQSLDPVLFSISLCSAIFFFLLGIYVFRKTEAYFADLA